MKQKKNSEDYEHMGCLKEVLLFFPYILSSLLSNLQSPRTTKGHSQTLGIINNDKKKESNVINLGDHDNAPTVKEVVKHSEFSNSSPEYLIASTPYFDIKFKVDNKLYSNDSDRITVFENGTFKSVNLTKWLSTYLNVNSQEATNIIIQDLDNIKASQNLETDKISINILPNPTETNTFTIQIALINTSDSNYTNNLYFSLIFTSKNPSKPINISKKTLIPSIPDKVKERNLNFQLIQDLAIYIANTYLQHRNDRQSEE